MRTIAAGARQNLRSWTFQKKGHYKEKKIHEFRFQNSWGRILWASNLATSPCENQVVLDLLVVKGGACFLFTLKIKYHWALQNWSSTYFLFTSCHSILETKAHSERTKKNLPTHGVLIMQLEGNVMPRFIFKRSNCLDVKVFLTNPKRCIIIVSFSFWVYLRVCIEF